ncbi:MAG: M28 family peptidase, partial [Gemmatimonadota bacterium]
MKRWIATFAVAMGVLSAAGPATAQNFPTNDPILREIWREGTENSHVYTLAQTLTDSIGPRLTGSPGMNAAHNWAVEMYRKWGIEARNEQYGTWTGWRRGITHIDLIEPRVRTLEGTLLAWSPGTNGKKVEGGVAILPDVQNADEFRKWLPSVKGKFVMISFPEPTCRTDDNWEEYGLPETVEAMRKARDEARQAWNERVRRTGMSPAELADALASAGARGILTLRWSNGWGVNKIFGAQTRRIPTLDLSCEDYGLVFRLAENNQGPKLRLEADAQFLGQVPVFNTIATIPGTEKPNEYVLLSAHFDSWDGASGATDNATGTVTMMEAMRILKKVYPNPKRTIIVGHWGGEEQGLNGS